MNNILRLMLVICSILPSALVAAEENHPEEALLSLEIESFGTIVFHRGSTEIPFSPQQAPPFWEKYLPYMVEESDVIDIQYGWLVNNLNHYHESPASSASKDPADGSQEMNTEVSSSSLFMIIKLSDVPLVGRVSAVAEGLEIHSATIEDSMLYYYYNTVECVLVASNSMAEIKSYIDVSLGKRENANYLGDRPYSKYLRGYDHFRLSSTRALFQKSKRPEPSAQLPALPSFQMLALKVSDSELIYDNIKIYGGEEASRRAYEAYLSSGEVADEELSHDGSAVLIRTILGKEDIQEMVQEDGSSIENQ